jgi:hypothetical protein
LSRIGRDRVAVGAGLVAPFAVAAALLPLRANLVNTDVALILVLVIVGVAASGDRPAGLPAAVTAAVWFDFFWTQPYETLAITTRADIETAVLLLLLGLAVTETGVRAQRQHAAASREAGFRTGFCPPRRRPRPEGRRAHSSTGSASSSRGCSAYLAPSGMSSVADVRREPRERGGTMEGPARHPGIRGSRCVGNRPRVSVRGGV